MRLVRTKTLTLHEFHGAKIPRYAIFSHRWEKGEISFQDVRDQKRTSENANGWAKLQNLCELAHRHRWNYVWIDTCCIDKSSSSELTEAINSMFGWYQRSGECYAYLNDVPSGLAEAEKEEAFRESEWFERGWTLQELIAPDRVTFISQDWQEILGTRDSLDMLISSITGIDDVAGIDLSSESIAIKMSWAADRVCERLEDYAYCLMGLFGVNMPLLYGEGRFAAFFRLQLEIMKVSDDESIFAWFGAADRKLARDSGLLASSADDFRYSTDVHSFVFDTGRPPFSYTHMGVQFEPKIIHCDRQLMEGEYSRVRFRAMIPLNCFCGAEKRPLVLALKKSGPKDSGYCRIMTDRKQGIALEPEMEPEQSVFPLTAEPPYSLSGRWLPQRTLPPPNGAVFNTTAQWYYTPDTTMTAPVTSDRARQPKYWWIGTGQRQLIFVRDPNGFHHKLDGEDQVYESESESDDDDTDEMDEDDSQRKEKGFHIFSVFESTKPVVSTYPG